MHKHINNCGGIHRDKVVGVAKISLDRSAFTNYMTGIATSKPFFYNFGTFSGSSLNNLPKISIISGVAQGTHRNAYLTEAGCPPLNNRLTAGIKLSKVQTKHTIFH